MTCLLTSDIHMTEKASDAHRWGLFAWLAQEAKRLDVDFVGILGDLTDAKDRHSASLVSKMVEGINTLRAVCPVVILKGNHDYKDFLTPFFGFLENFENVYYVTQPKQFQLRVMTNERMTLWLPNESSPSTEWPEHGRAFRMAEFVFTHQTYTGAILDNGTRSPDGVSTSIFKELGCKGAIFSGDIHVPQIIGRPPVCYVGSPYRIDFGDSFDGRVIHLDEGGVAHDLYYPCPNKHLVEITPEGEVTGEHFIQQGDHVKVRVRLRRADYPLWPKLKQQIKQMAERGEWVLYGPELRRADEEQSAPIAVKKTRVSMKDLVAQYAEQNELDQDLLSIGLEIIAE